MAADGARQRRPRRHSPSPRVNGKRKGSGAAKHPGMAWARRIGSAGAFWPIRSGERGSHVPCCPHRPCGPGRTWRREGGFRSAALRPVRVFTPKPRPPCPSLRPLRASFWRPLTHRVFAGGASRPNAAVGGRTAAVSCGTQARGARPPARPGPEPARPSPPAWEIATPTAVSPYIPVTLRSSHSRPSHHVSLKEHVIDILRLS